jgi:hypothetical protein
MHAYLDGGGTFPSSIPFPIRHYDEGMREGGIKL